MRFRLSNCMKLFLCLIVLLISRFLSLRIESKECLIYCAVFLLYVIGLFFFMSGIVYAVCSITCIVGLFVLFDFNTVLLLFPLLFFLVLNTIKTSTEKKGTLKIITIFRSVYMGIVEPALILLYLAFVLKSGVLSQVLHNFSSFTWCFVVLTVALLYYFRIRSHSKEGNDSDIREEKASQYGYLLITYLESIALNLLMQNTYYYIVILTDLWLGTVLYLHIKEKDSERTQMEVS